MKRWLGGILPGVAVALAFAASGRIEAVGWRTLALFASVMLLQAFYVQRFPRVVAMEYALKLKPGQKVEVEGK